MSTTRWIIETLCDHDNLAAHHPNGKYCPGGSRIVVDPGNLPPEAIQRAAEAVFGVRSGNRWDSVTETTRVGYRKAAEAAVRAFLSDPEPGDQTLACWAKAPNHIHDSECGVRS